MPVAIKDVIHTNMENYPLIVENCPLNKRIWKKGFKVGQSFACVFEDCYKCIHGVVICDKKYFNNGNTIIDGKIQKVQCSWHNIDYSRWENADK
jgi:hypothetical protein